MAAVAVITCIVCAFFAYSMEKKLYNPAFLFSTLWGLISFFTSLRLYGIYEVSDLVYLIVALGTVSFCVGCLINRQSRRYWISIGSRKNVYFKYSEEFNYKVIYIVSGIVMVYMLAQAVAVFFLYRSGYNLFEIRSALQGYSDADFVTQITALRRGNVWMTRFYDWIVLPGFHSLIVVTCIDMIIGKRDKVLFAMNLINVALKIYSEGTRVVVFNAVIYVAIILFIYGKRFQISHKMKKWIKRAIILGIALLVIISNVRLESMEKSIAEEIYLYFCCCMPLLDIYAESFIKGSVFTYGAASLYGIIQPAVRILQYFGLPGEWYSNAGEIISRTETFYKIRDASYSTGANAYTTLYYYFLSDAGIVGCIIGSLLFGFVCHRSYTNLQRKIRDGKNHYRQLFVFLVFVLFIFNSFIRIQFSRVDFANMLIFSLLFFKKGACDDSKKLER